MQYIYEYELSAFILMASLLFIIRSQYSLETRSMRYFLYFTYTALIESGLSVASCLILDSTAAVPKSLVYGCNLIFFIAETVRLVFFFLYIYVLCDLKCRTSPRIALWGIIPALLHILFVLSNTWTDLLYALDPGNIYVSEPYAFIAFAVRSYYLLVTFAVAFHFRSRLQTRHIIILAEFTILSLTTAAIEFLYPPLLLTGAANALVILSIYAMMQNPTLYQESVTGLGNSRALSLRMLHYIRRNIPFGVICIDLSTNRAVFRFLEYRLRSRLEEMMGNWLEQEMPPTARAYYLPLQRCFFLIVSREDLDLTTKRIEDRFAQPWYVEEDLDLTLAINLFIETYPENFSTADELSIVIQSLRRDHRNAHGIILRPNDPIQKLYQESERIQKVLTDAIENRTLAVYFQPIIEADSERPRLLEALARLKDADGKFIPPDRFIALAEQTGLIYDLQQLVLEKVCTFCRDSLLTLPDQPIEGVHVNLSVEQCMKPDMASRILETIDRYAIPPSLIKLELTEHIALVTPALMQRHLKELRARGICFSLDDYGTGNANISYLISYDFDTIKFDRSIMQAFFKQEKAHRILEREFLLMQDLGLTVIAEGIETAEEVEALREHGIGYIQGYYYSRPLPPEECIEYLKKNA